MLPGAGLWGDEHAACSLGKGSMELLRKELNPSEICVRHSHYQNWDMQAGGKEACRHFWREKRSTEATTLKASVEPEGLRQRQLKEAGLEGCQQD